ncbi:WG repeat-containing protein [Thiosocius teredinicola]|uniref:WG repeat-containing protein n=1 Tax=Thiosocius teredinicola TaxID=1973002 RepID=UPI0013DE4E83
MHQSFVTRIERLRSPARALLLLALLGSVQQPHAQDSKLQDSAISQLHTYQDGMAAFEIRGSWGFVDRAGHVAVEPAYSEVRDFSEGLAAVSIDDHWGYVDRRGELKIPAAFTYARDFKQGLAAASTADSQWGYIDTDGNWAIRPTFSGASDFVDGVAIVNEGYNQHRLIDRSGKLIKKFPADYDIDEWKRDFGVLIVTKPPSSSYFNIDGQTVDLPPGVSDFQNYGDGLLVRADTQQGGLAYGATDLEGNWVVKPRFKSLGVFHDGVAIAENEAGFGLIDKTGEFTAPAHYASIERIASGHFIARRREAPHHVEALATDGQRLFPNPCPRLQHRELGAWTVFIGCEATWAIHDKGTPQQVPFSIPEVAQVGDHLLIQDTAAASAKRPTATAFTLFDPTGVVISSDSSEAAAPYDWAMLIKPEQHADAEAAPTLPLALLVGADGDVAIVTYDHRIVHKDEWRYDPLLLEYGSTLPEVYGPMVMKTAGGYGSIDASGNWLLAPTFTRLQPFVKGVARARNGEKELLVGAKGNTREIPEGFRFAGVVTANRAAIVKDRENGERERIELNLATGEQYQSIEQPGYFGYSKTHAGLKPAEDGNKWGLVDTLGSWVVPATYDRTPEALKWNNSFLGWKISQNEKNNDGWNHSLYGLLSPTGEVLSAPRYDKISVQRETGLLLITAQGAYRTGLMSVDGKILLPPIYKNIRYTDNGWFELTTDEQVGLMGTDGEWLVQPGFFKFHDLSRSPISREIIADEDVLIDTAGRVSSADMPLSPLDDNPDYWLYRVESNDKGEDQTVYYGFDWKPRVTLPGRIDKPFSEGTVTVTAGSYDNPGVQLIDSSGKRSALLPYETIEPMVGGLAVAKPFSQDDRTARYGFVDKTGALVIPADYERADSFSEQRAIIVKHGNYGAIDAAGKLLFHSAWRCGKYPVVIDADERIVWPEEEAKITECPAEN